MSTILALETSCDETAAAVVRDGRIVLASELNSQTGIHQKFGGVVPEVAARYHLESVNEIVDLALNRSGIAPQDLDAVACTQGPGLIGTPVGRLVSGQGNQLGFSETFIGCRSPLRTYLCELYRY